MSDPKESPTVLDVDSLPPTEYLALEALAARHRLGEQSWTFPAQPRIVAAVHALARRGLVDVKSGVAPKTILAWLTDAGRSAALREGYEPPILRLIEASSLGTSEAKALRDSVPDEVAEKIVARSKEFAERSDLPAPRRRPPLVGPLTKEESLFLEREAQLDADYAALVATGDLPVGQQSKGSPLIPDAVWDRALEAGGLLAAVEIAYEAGKTAEVARVRAQALRDFAEVMRVSAEEAPVDEPARWPWSAYALAAVKAEEHAGKPAESVVAAPDRVWWYHEPCRWASGPEKPDEPRWWSRCPGCGSGEGDWLQLAPVRQSVTAAEEL